MGPVLGLIVGGGKGALQGLTNLATAFFGGPMASALAISSSLLSSSPKSPRTSPADRDRLFANIDPRTPRKIVYGRTAMATDIRDQEYTGANDEYFHRFVVCASHKVNSIEEIWFDDELAWTVGGGVQGELTGYLTVAPILEGSSGNAINISARMGTTRRYTGLAYVHFRYKLTGNSKKATSPFAQSIPTRVTIIGNGMELYDPRLDSNRGGSGAHRIDDQSTWAWDDDACRNLALQKLNYLIGYKINGKLAVGKGIPPARIDIQSYADAANDCDETVSLLAGGTEPRYRGDGIFSESDDMGLVINQFKSSMNAITDDAGGQIRVIVLKNDLGSPVAAFDENDILGEVSWKPGPDLGDRFNIVRGTHTDPSDESLYQAIDYPEQAITSTDGIDRTFTVDFPLVQSHTQCQRLAKQRLQRAQFAGMMSFTGQATFWKVLKNDIITLSFPPLGMTAKLFRVVDITIQQDGTVPIVLREEDAAIYAWDKDESPAVVPAASDSYIRSNDPIVKANTLALAGNALANSFTIGLSGNITQADNAATNVRVSIPIHDRQYSAGYGKESVNAGTLDIDYSSSALIFYDDEDLDGGAVTYQFIIPGIGGAVTADAYPSETNPFRHFIAFVTTQDGAGVGGSAGGSGPPGSGGWDGSPGTVIP